MHPRSALLLSLMLVACDGGGTDGTSPADAAPVDAVSADGTAVDPQQRRELSHRFPPFEIAPGEEIPSSTRSWKCQSWTLGNDEPLFINRVESHNDGAWHHSNWFFVPENVYEGPDGTWDCAERGFDEVGAALGDARGVLFAQSTQARAETQRFAPGAAYRIPPRAKVVGDVHLINVTGEAMDSSMELTLHAIPESEVETRLEPMSFTNQGLQIPPRSESRFTMNCNIAEAFGGSPVSFDVHYVLPHYHDLGAMMRLDVVDSSGETTNFFETTTTVGEPLGQSYDPPRTLEDVSELRFTCGYDNPRDETVHYGIGDQEMCVFLAYHDASRTIAGLGEETAHAGEEGTVERFETNCPVVAF